MNKEQCIVCGAPHTDAGPYCDAACLFLDARHGAKALKKWVGRELGKEMYGEEFEVVAEGRGCIYKEDYAYADVAADNCRNL